MATERSVAQEPRRVVRLGDHLTGGPYLAKGDHCLARSDGSYLCTAPIGHTAGDIPHIAHGIWSGVIAMWDNERAIELDDDDSNIGETL